MRTAKFLAPVLAFSLLSGFAGAQHRLMSIGLGGSPPLELTNVVDVAMGNKTVIALLSDGTVTFFGDTFIGFVPDGLNNVRAVGAGAGHAIAVKADGTVVMWGNNSQGQLNIPAGLDRVVSVACGASHTTRSPSSRTSLHPKFRQPCSAATRPNF